MNGTVKFFNNMKRFGFIKSDDDETKEYFFHESGFAEGLSSVDEGDRVTFDVDESGDRGPKAINVALAPADE